MCVLPLEPSFKAAREVQGHYIYASLFGLKKSRKNARVEMIDDRNEEE